MRSPSLAPTASPTSCEAALCGQMPALGQRHLVHSLDVPGAGDDRIGRAVDLAAHEAHHRPSRLVRRAHERERVLGAEVAPPRLRDPVRIRVLECGLRRCRLGQLVEQPRDSVCEPAKHGVRERDRALEPGAPNELDRLVDGRVPRDAVDEAELVRAEAERGSHRRVEAVDAPASERLDRVVERAGALHRAEREPLRERAVAIVESSGGGPEGSIGVGVVLEHAHEHVVRGGARRAYCRRPRSHAS